MAESLEDMENLSFAEAEVKDLYSQETEKDNFSEGGFDERNVMSRVRLF